ncbi:hypothetical protein JCM10908_001581 [Rhodotorula pacifica]|uniref:uncharacterized protein n=1 Tax=Rhodotorula pacifica TaxID=1495444 RepID=UPI003172FF50
MALTSAKLPAPLRLRAQPSSIRSLSTAEAHAHLAQFLTSDASTLVAGAAGTGATRASIVRLVKGLKESLDAPPPVVKDEATSVVADKEKDTKKRRKSDVAAGQKDKKRRKTVA